MHSLVVDRAAIFIRPDGAPKARQQEACLQYCERHKYHVVSICPELPDCVGLIEDRHVHVIVTAYNGNDAHVERMVRQAGGRLEYVRPPRKTRRMEPDDVILQMHERGADVPTISHLLDTPTREIRALIDRVLRRGKPPRGR